MIQTLIPAPVKAQARGHRLGYALTPRALLLLLAGCSLVIPGFFHPRSPWMWPWAMVAWDALIVLLVLFDAMLLPAPAAITVERRFADSPSLGEPTKVELEVTQESNQILDIRISDAANPALASMPLSGRIRAFPRDPVRVTISCIPIARGDVTLGKVYLRYRGVLKLAERWAQADLEQ
ncbi:MAG: DUF58 domain-containing protein, partial [Acidobacteriaceae bacterium]